MTRKDLLAGDILVADYSYIPTGVAGQERGLVYYIVLVLNNGNKIAAAFQGDANCGNRPSGWYDLNDDYEIPYDVVAIYRPKTYYGVFNGDFDNKDLYEKLY